MERQLGLNMDQPKIFLPQMQRPEPDYSLGALPGLSVLQFGSSPAQATAVNTGFSQIAMQQLKAEPGNTVSVLQARVTGPVRLIQRVATAWSLNNQELANLLAYPASRFAGEVLAGRLMFSDNEDRADRARLLYLIHDTLSDLFVDPQDEKWWIRSPLLELGNVAPLNYMLAHRIPGMTTVREFVEQRLANR